MKSGANNKLGAIGYLSGLRYLISFVCKMNNVKSLQGLKLKIVEHFHIPSAICIIIGYLFMHKMRDICEGWFYQSLLTMVGPWSVAGIPLL